MFFSEAVDISRVDPSVVSVFNDEMAVHLQLTGGEAVFENASLVCSSAKRGRGHSLREVVLRLDEPCVPFSSSNSSWEQLFNESCSSSSPLSNASCSSASSAGYRCDWERLVDLGVFKDESTSQSTVVDDEEWPQVKINVTSGFVADFASPANALNTVKNLVESLPGKGTIHGCGSIMDILPIMRQDNRLLLPLWLRVSPASQCLGPIVFVPCSTFWSL